MTSYTEWQIDRWETPLSDIRSLVMVSMSDCHRQLTFTFEAPRESGGPRWELKFNTYPGYRNLLEEFRIQLWEHLDSTDQRCGNTFFVTNSPWIQTLRKTEGVFDHYYPEMFHYVMATEDDVIEVLSPETPVVSVSMRQADGEPPAGKSTVFYAPAGREKMERVFPQLKRGSQERSD